MRGALVGRIEQRFVSTTQYPSREGAPVVELQTRLVTTADNPPRSTLEHVGGQLPKTPRLLQQLHLLARCGSQDDKHPILPMQMSHRSYFRIVLGMG